MQLYSVEQKRSQALEAHAAAFSTIKASSCMLDWSLTRICSLCHARRPMAVSLVLDRHAWQMECLYLLNPARPQHTLECSSGCMMQHRGGSALALEYVFHEADIGACLHRHQALPQPAQSSALRRRPSPMAT